MSSLRSMSRVTVRLVLRRLLAFYAGEVIDWPGKRRVKPIRSRVLA